MPAIDLLVARSNKQRTHTHRRNGLLGDERPRRVVDADDRSALLRLAEAVEHRVLPLPAVWGGRYGMGLTNAPSDITKALACIVCTIRPKPKHHYLLPRVSKDDARVLLPQEGKVRAVHLVEHDHDAVIIC